MEQKKILWIILSVALFLVVVLGIGLIWLRPVTEGVPAADGSAETADTTGSGFDAIEYIREGDGFPGLEKTEPRKADDFIAVAGEIVLGENPAQTVPRETPAVETVKVPVAVVPTAAPAAAAASSPPVQKPAETAPAPVVKKPVTVVEYWIQAGAFESSSRAEEVKGVLVEKGFSPIISTRTLNGSTYFRVRLGPYPNEGEASKFLGWVKEIEGFSSSWISEVTAVR